MTSCLDTERIQQPVSFLLVQPYATAFIRFLIIFSILAGETKWEPQQNNPISDRGDQICDVNPVHIHSKGRVK